MSDEKKTVETNSTQQQTQQATPTPQEIELQNLDLANRRAVQPGLIGAQTSGLQLIQQLLQGQQLPGFLRGLPGGISPDVTQSIVNQSIADIQPTFQQSGLLDSGVNAEISARTAADIRNQAEQFNIGNRLNLLNLALSGQAQVQQPILGQSAILGQRLAGLRTIGQSGSGTNLQTTTSMNPFLQSFQTSLGSGLGSSLAKLPQSAASAGFSGGA